MCSTALITNLLLWPLYLAPQNGWTALIWASYNSRLEVMQVLLTAGANIEAKSHVGCLRVDGGGGVY